MSNGNYDNNNSGVLFVNEKRTKDTHPHLRGSATIDGVEYWISCWTKTSQGGKKFQSLAFTPKDEQPKQQSRQTAQDDDGMLGGDDLPTQRPTTAPKKSNLAPQRNYDSFDEDEDIPF
ncbi:MAG: putative single-stranded DNA-binding protein [Caudoviricetes sp.]|nr:MAG: putative single-stranded DNA-binding protein [Caudoviricetes sp.]